jgi:hypothetical protein
LRDVSPEAITHEIIEMAAPRMPRLRSSTMWIVHLFGSDFEVKDCVNELFEQAKSRKKLPPTHGRASQNPARPCGPYLLTILD